ncbi:MAG: hypothetical protein IPN69_00055 [Acidobacteria bacterium]|nr:hypothetical protein [Acidobacteriota bacterium]
MTAKSVDQGRTSLLMSAFLKIPMQFFILMIGIMVFVFYQFQRSGDLQQHRGDQGGDFRKSSRRSRRNTARPSKTERHRRSSIWRLILPEARQKYIEANKGVQRRAGDRGRFRQEESDEKFNDVNYVFPTFVLSYMPIGVIGLIIAAIFAAAMSSISAELNALATATTIDFYRRLINPDATDKQYLLVGKISTLGWGVFACIVAIYSTNLGSLIEVVNKFRSFFYGSLLGVFALAFVFPRAKARGRFMGSCAGSFRSR